MYARDHKEKANMTTRPFDARREVGNYFANVVLKSSLKFGTFSDLRLYVEYVTEYINQRIRTAESAQQSILDAVLAVEIGISFRVL